MCYGYGPTEMLYRPIGASPGGLPAGEATPSRQSYAAEMAASHFLQVQVKSQVISLQVQVKSQVIWSDVKSSHKSFGPNTSQVTSVFVQVQVKSHIILSSCNTQSGPGITSIYSGWVEWGFYALSASKAIFRARTYNCNLFSPVMMIT